MNRLRCGSRPLIIPLLLSTASLGTVTTAASWPAAVRRVSDDRDQDLIDALVRDGRFDDALAICQRRQRTVRPESDGGGKWVIRQSEIMAQRQMTKDRFDDSEVEVAQQPVSELLEAYPQHRRRLFLESQLVAVSQAAAVHSVLRAAVSPTGDQQRQRAAAVLLRATAATESLSERVDAAVSQMEAQRSDTDLALIADLQRLQQQLRVEIVSLALLQTELFSHGSADCIAAATKAEESAEDAIARLPVGTAARLEAERLKVEAVFRAQQLSRAAAGLAELVRAAPTPTPPRILAMQVRQDLARGASNQARRRLEAFYGDRPQDAPRSIEMDLARLEFLLQEDDGQGVGRWLDVIEERGGSYGRRRGEAIALASLHWTSTDPALVAAQGQDWLRRGNPGRAGELLAAAAAAETEPDKAIQRASEAAAALVSAGRNTAAAELLRDIALARPTGGAAAAAHLQAIVMISSDQDIHVSQRVQSMLRANLKQWPSGPSASVARRWLQKILIAQDRMDEAAEVASAVPADEVTPEDVDLMFDRWRAAFRIQSDDRFGELSERFQASWEPLRDSEIARSSYRLGAALLLDRDALTELPPGDGADPVSTFADALIEFRLRQVGSDLLRDPPSQWMKDASRRLMRDGRLDPASRRSIATLLRRWSDGSEPSLDQVEQLLWLGDTVSAIDLAQQLIDQAPRAAEIIRQAAELLGSSDEAEAREEAIKLWDRLAAGSPQGSQVWHRAKLAAIRLLQRAGRHDEARRRAKFVLLTQPDIDDDFRRRYQTASQ